MSNSSDELPASIRGVLRDSYRIDAPPDGRDELPAPAPPTIRTEFSTTVFSGQPADWVRYLGTAPETRYEANLAVHVFVQDSPATLALCADGADAAWLAELLRTGYGLARQAIAHKPNVLQAVDDLVFGRTTSGRPVVVRLCPTLPSLGTRETAHPHSNAPEEVRIVLQSQYVRSVHEATKTGGALSSAEKLGITWSLVSRFLSHLAYPAMPRDRFVAKIDVFARMTFIAINLLYEKSSGGRLLPTRAGAVYETLLSEASDIPRRDLSERHPYFRMLGRLSFMLRAKSYAEYEQEARIAAREYLDAGYLRLSLAGAMPAVPQAMTAMAFERKKGKVKVPSPQVGLYGVLDEDDRKAWETVRKPFEKLGFTLLRQLGMGDFGRVYEVLNDNNPAFPARVALKVDRLIGKKKHAILAADQAFQVGRHLASAPHFVRLYDTGTLRDERFTYHVLQLIDGDTLDNLVGVTGEEHGSMNSALRSGRTERQARLEYGIALASRSEQQWRRARMGLPFRFALSPTMLLDLLTSVLLSLEEVHQLDYTINDLKNDNLMMSRRGQIKGIDLDSFAPISSDTDKITDFMFLSAALILLLFNASVNGPRPSVQWEQLAQDENALRRELEAYWPIGDVEKLSDGRLDTAAVTQLLVDLVLRSRGLVYAKDPDRFSADIVRLIELKRSLLVEDLVID